MTNFSYNRGRPFLIISQFFESKKGHYSESIEIVDNVQNKHLTDATVIVDIFKRCAIKNSFADEYGDEEIIQSYLNKYSSEVADSINVWTKKIGKDEEKAKKLIESLEKELEISENDLQ